jgi:hypothetical protein
MVSLDGAPRVMARPGQLAFLRYPLKVLAKVLDPIFGLTALFGKEACIGPAWRRKRAAGRAVVDLSPSLNGVSSPLRILDQIKGRSRDQIKLSAGLPPLWTAFAGTPGEVVGPQPMGTHREHNEGRHNKVVREILSYEDLEH